MRVEIPELGSDDTKAKSAGAKIEWREDKEGNSLLVVTANATCELDGGGTIKPERKMSFDVHDSEACDAIRAFKRIADIVRLDVDVDMDISNEQKPLFANINAGVADGEA